MDSALIASEEEEQKVIFQWARMMAGKYPELELLHAIPNGGYRTKATAKKLKKTGLKRGVPDMCLPVARGKYHGLYIELKREAGGRVTPEQREWIERLNNEGYLAKVCRGSEEAIDTIEKYLNM